MSRSLLRTPVRFSNGRFVVTIRHCRSQAVLITSNSNSETIFLAGTYPHPESAGRVLPAVYEPAADSVPPEWQAAAGI